MIDGGVIRNDITNTDNAQTPENSATVKWITSEDGVEKTYYGDLETVLKNAKAGDTITLLQDESLSIDTNIPVGVTVVIPEGKELVVPTNSTLTNSGAIDNKGILSNDGGSIVNNENGIIQNNHGVITLVIDNIRRDSNGEAVGKKYVPEIFDNAEYDFEAYCEDDMSCGGDDQERTLQEQYID